ncbi:TauD/TfdA dioxygenase family protein [Niallia endozanthoxylica]|uniref:TauD/TfdA family dioxygenase n=1 Tax=Niallia endozanthoxylica TaxID=2036016 RepID=A0A5J5HZF8_9BACI|nr:TauD/TfdA family dioxygenase [Niallia endozanthoxylica]KAA9027599.1 TauD/TfdA family dioxygenase [Niallia endozanthoxylica]
MTTQTNQLKVVPVAGRIGAEVQGVQLGKDLDITVLQELKQLLNQYKVLFFRGQHNLDDSSQEEFAGLFGEPYAHPTVPVKDKSQFIFELDSEQGAKANHWHTDVTFVPEVPKYSILRGVTIPNVGGDTVWANTNTAYEGLPEELKRLADELWAIHTNEFDYAQLVAKAIDEQDEVRQKYRSVFESTVYKTKHPVVHVHAETGKKHLLLGGFVGKLEGYSTSESEKLFSILQSYVTRLENTVRWSWTEGDVVIWDNLATQHYAVADYDEHRVVRRVTVGKEIPVNKDNQRSTLITKQ